jgi:hypothetical protein
MAEIPPDKNVVGIVSTRVVNGELVTRTGIAWRINDAWALAAEAETDWADDHRAELAVRWAR